MKQYNKSNISSAHKLRTEATKWEKHLWYDYLCKYPIRFQRQKAIDNYIVDFYCSVAQLAIELDGSYHNISQQAFEDKKRNSALNELDIYVLRFKNSEIDNNFNKVCEQIDYTVKKRIKELYP